MRLVTPIRSRNCSRVSQPRADQLAFHHGEVRGGPAETNRSQLEKQSGEFEKLLHRPRGPRHGGVPGLSPPPNRLFITQGFDRVKPRGFPRGIETEDDAHRGGHTRPRQSQASRSRGPMHEVPNQERADAAEKDAHKAADQAEHHGFDEELPQNVDDCGRRRPSAGRFRGSAP